MTATTASPIRDLSAHDPRKEIWLGSALAAFLVLGLGGAAMMTPMDAAVTASGTVRASSSRLTVQSPVQGVIAATLVANGDRVRQGQVLVELAGADALAQERALAGRVFALLAEIARLEAEIRGETTPRPPAEFALLNGEDRKLADQAMALEQAQLTSFHRLTRSEQALQADRARQAQHQMTGNQARLEAMRTQESLTRQELETYRELQKKGLTTRSRVLSLERSVAAAQGDMGSTSAEIARLRSQISETRMQLVDIRNQRQQQGSERLRQAHGELETARAQWQAARTALARTAIRAPEAGTVSAAEMPVAGTVVTAGAALMQVVPQSPSLTIATHIALQDAHDVRDGQQARIRLTGIQSRDIPTLAGTVSFLSADAMQDERSGQPYYLATISVPHAELAARGLSPSGGDLRAGTPVQVILPVQSRSFWDFLVSPLSTRLSGTFTQR